MPEISTIEVTVPAPIQTVVVEVPALIQTVVVEVPGQQGPKGDAGGETLTRTALSNLSALRVVSAAPGGVAYADPSDPASLSTIIGVTTGAASAGQPVTIRRIGEMSDSGWSWSPGQPVFVGASGALTQSVPVGPVRQIAFAISATQLFIDPRTLIRRG